MSTAFAYYHSKKENVLRQLDLLRQIAEEVGDEDFARDAGLQIDSLNKEHFEIMVVGEFSNGKSTFLNALLGRKVLPAAVRPMTAILNKIRYAPSPFYRLHYRDQQRLPEDLSETEFHAITAPEDDADAGESLRRLTDRIRSIEYAEIGIPAEICGPQVILIDSPGTNDLDPAREAITNHYIPRSDAVVVVLNVMMPLSESELNLIKHRILAADMAKLFFVLNFKDLARPEQLEQALQYVHENLRPVVGSVRVFAVSSLHALQHRLPAESEESAAVSPRRSRRRPLLSPEETGLPEFEQALNHFLQFERGELKLIRPIKSGIRIAREMLERYVAFERSTLNRQIGELQEKTDELYRQLDSLRQKGEHSSLLIQTKLAAQEQVLARWYEAELKKISTAALHSLDRHYTKNCDTAYLSSLIETDIAPLQTRIGPLLNDKIEQVVQDAVRSESRDFKEGMNRLRQQWNFMIATEATTGVLANFYERSVIDYLKESESSSLFFAGILTLFKKASDSVMEFFTGIDQRKSQIESNLKGQFEAPIDSKVKAFVQEWKRLSLTVARSFEQEMRRSLNDAESRIRVSIRNNKLTESEYNTALLELENRFVRLESIRSELSHHQSYSERGVQS